MEFDCVAYEHVGPSDLSGSAVKESQSGFFAEEPSDGIVVVPPPCKIANNLVFSQKTGEAYVVGRRAASSIC